MKLFFIHIYRSGIFFLLFVFDHIEITMLCSRHVLIVSPLSHIVHWLLLFLLDKYNYPLLFRALSLMFINSEAVLSICLVDSMIS